MAEVIPAFPINRFMGLTLVLTKGLGVTVVRL